MDLAWGYMTGDLFLHMLHTHLPSEQGLRVPDPVVETPVTQALLPCCIFSWVYIYIHRCILRLFRPLCLTSVRAYHVQNFVPSKTRRLYGHLNFAD